MGYQLTLSAATGLYVQPVAWTLCSSWRARERSPVGMEVSNFLGFHSARKNVSPVPQGLEWFFNGVSAHTECCNWSVRPAGGLNSLQLLTGSGAVPCRDGSVQFFGISFCEKKRIPCPPGPGRFSAVSKTCPGLVRLIMDYDHLCDWSVTVDTHETVQPSPTTRDFERHLGMDCRFPKWWIIGGCSI